MFGLGFTEVVILLLLVLLVFGPARLPEIAKGIGKGMRQIRRATKDLDTVPEIREIRKAVDEIRSPVMETLREPILDPDEQPPPRPPAPTAGSKDDSPSATSSGSEDPSPKEAASPPVQQRDSAPPPTSPKAPDSKS